MTRPIVLLMLAVAAIAGPTCAQESPMWRLVAQSDVILTGELSPIPEAIPPRTYVTTPIINPHLIKGSADSAVSVRWYSEPASYTPSIDQLSARGPRLVFLTRLDGEHYFAGNTPGALVPADPALIAEVEAEVVRQEGIISDWSIGSDSPLYAEVKAIIDQIAALPPLTREERRAFPTRQQQLFDQLIALGPDAVPAIIMLMDDERRLPDRHIELQNSSPDAFEAFRQYGPVFMTEALAAVLNQLTGENFGFIYNGSSPQRRRASINGWRIYLDHLRSTS